MKTTTNHQMETRTEGAMKLGMKVTAMAVGMMMISSAAMAGGKGTSGAQFLRIGAGARGPGMGSAISPVVDDATAIYWNPAGLAMNERRDVELSYNAYFKDTAAQFLGYAHPTSTMGTFGGGVSMFGVKDIQKRSAENGDADTPDLGTFATRDMALSFGWANKMELGTGAFHYGAALKYVSSDLNTASAKTGALDMGAIYKLGGETSQYFASLALLNLGGSLKFDSESDPLPLDLKPGIGWKRDLGRAGKLTAALDADLYVHDNLATVQPGVEYQIVPQFALRGGYQFGRSVGAGSGFAVGAGFRLMGLGIDYAFVPYGDLGDTHRVSLGYRFGPSGDDTRSARNDQDSTVASANGRLSLK